MECSFIFTLFLQLTSNMSAVADGQIELGTQIYYGEHSQA
jgi:hypothetical protein